jgi:hypothetical protein
MFKLKSLLCPILLSILTLLNGCVSMFAEKSDPVTITSEPEGAVVTFREQ